MCGLGGFGAVLGSVLGNAFGRRGLFLGALVGGVLAVGLVARLALWRGWIGSRQFWPTALGGTLGFALAALIATRTLSSPVGPILSTVLIGAGALVGLRFASGTPGGDRDRVA